MKSQEQVSQSVRVIRIFSALVFQPDQVTIENIAEVFGITRRTALRDIDKLRRAGIGLHFDRTSRHYQLDALAPAGLTCHSAQEPPRRMEDRLGLDWKESLVLLAALDMAGAPADSEFHALREQIREKILAYLKGKFGTFYSTIPANARILMHNPGASVEAMYRRVSDFHAGTAVALLDSPDRKRETAELCCCALELEGS